MPHTICGYMATQQEMDEWAMHRGGVMQSEPSASTYYDQIRSAYKAHGRRGAKCEGMYREVKLIELPRQPEEAEARVAFVWVRREGDPALARTTEEKKTFEESKGDLRAKKLLEQVMGRTFGPWFKTSFGLRRASLGGGISGDTS